MANGRQQLHILVRGSVALPRSVRSSCYSIAEQILTPIFHGSGISSNDYTNLPTTGICRLNPSTSQQDYWFAEGNIFVGEPLPVAKRNGDEGSWLLSLFYDARMQRTSLAIFDSDKIPGGPVARVHLRYSVSYGLHNWFHQT